MTTNRAAAVEAGLQLLDDDGGALKVRQARKAYACEGDGAATLHTAEGCVGTIEPGTFYLEVLWTAPGYQSGQRVCPVCARAFFEPWVASS